MSIFKSLVVSVLLPSLTCYTKDTGHTYTCGNKYTPSLYGGLASVFSQRQPRNPEGQEDLHVRLRIRIGFLLLHHNRQGRYHRGQREDGPIRKNRLVSIKVVPCQEYVEAMILREKNNNVGKYTPTGSLDNRLAGNLLPGRDQCQVRQLYGGQCFGHPRSRCRKQVSVRKARNMRPKSGTAGPRDWGPRRIRLNDVDERSRQWRITNSNYPSAAPDIQRSDSPRVEEIHVCLE